LMGSLAGIFNQSSTMSPSNTDILIPLFLDMWSTQKVLASFIAKRNVEGTRVAFIDVIMQLGSLPVLPEGRC
jgi:hypothetical protein